MLYCPNCGEYRGERRYCQHCGNKNKRNQSFIIILLLVLFSISAGVIYFSFSESASFEKEIVSHDLAANEKIASKTIPVMKKSELNKEKKTALTEIIATAQETVYTIFTQGSQGSGFLYNENGAVLTNAHVVEGEIDVFVKNVNGREYPGKVIGYSNEIDIAVIYVPDLVGIAPFAMETTDSALIGEEVIALGSPLGLENSASMGYITGKNRNFTIGTFLFENVYQMSAPVSPGNSGGPLISKDTEKIIAINSAKNTQEAAIGFSIPLHNVADLVQAWIKQPMTEEEIIALFYGANGEWFYGDLWSFGNGYFDGGEYADDYSYYDYWEYYYDDFWSEYGNELWEYDQDNSYNYYYDWYNDDDYYNWYDDEDYDSWYEYEYGDDEYDTWYEYEYDDDEYDTWYEYEYDEDESSDWYESEYDDEE